MMTSNYIAATGLNQAALAVCQAAVADHRALGVQHHVLPCGAHVLDFGVHVRGGLSAGIQLARIAMADQAEISISPGSAEVSSGPWVQVSTNRPVQACMLSQYAGWPVKHNKFFAMGSGPMRVRRGREELLEELNAQDSQALAVGTLECDQLPDCDVAINMAEQCQVLPAELWIAVAPTSSLAGCVQVVARSVETSLHKLHSLGFDLRNVKSAYGTAPVPPPSPDFVKGIGRTNDAILYAGLVTLWVDAEDEQLKAILPKLPSNSSSDFGAPFAEIFKRYEYDFYKVDPGLFSPAVITLVNLKSGNSFIAGQTRPDVIAHSFGTVPCKG